jgi:type I restriction enzyme S subunit
MSEVAAFCPIEDLIDGNWPGEWGEEPESGNANTIVYRSTDIDDSGNLNEEGGVRRFVVPLKCKSKVLRKGDLLLESSGGTPDRPVGRVAAYNGLRKESCLVSNFLRTLRPKPSVNSRYLLWQLIQLHLSPGIWRYQQQTTGIINLKHADYLRHKIWLPERNVQDEISATIDSFHNAIEKTESLIAKYQQIKAGLMHDLFTRGVTADGKLRPSREQAPELYKETPIGWIPKEWSVGLVKDCGSVQLGRQRSPNQLSGRWTTPYLRVANVFDGYIDYSDILEMDFKPVERDTFSVRRGDILLNEGQSLELVGRSAMFDGPENTYCFQNTIVRFRAYKNHMPNYYRYLFKWWLDTGRFMTIAKQTTSVAHLGADRFARLKCSILDKDEQNRIGDQLASMQLLIWQEECHAAKLRLLKSGLMHDLLTGYVRVPQDKVMEAPP